MSITLNQANTFTLTGAAFTDNFPAQLQIAPTPNLANSCGGTVTAAAAATSVSLTGGSIPRCGAVPGGEPVAVGEAMHVADISQQDRRRYRDPAFVEQLHEEDLVGASDHRLGVVDYRHALASGALGEAIREIVD